MSHLRLCHIAPIPVLKQVIGVSERTHLVVADKIVESTVYLDFYARRIERGDEVILDTMAFERPGQGTPYETLLYAIRRLRPTEIVLPDDMGDRWVSEKLTREALNELKYAISDIPGYLPRFMAVPHGKHIDEYLECAASIGFLSGVRTIGIQEEVEELYGLSREEVAKRVRSRVGGRELHFLGVQEDCEDLRSEWVRSTVRSCDTGKFVTWGLLGTVVNPDEEIPPYPGRKALGEKVTRESYFDFTPEPPRVAVAARNVNLWRAWLDRDGAPEPKKAATGTKGPEVKVS